MKKYGVILFSILLISCANDPMLETRDELEIRKTETAEQTLLRHNQTISAIKKQISDKQATQEIRLVIPDTCAEVNKQEALFWEKTTVWVDSLEKFEKFFKKVPAENFCTFCRSKDYSEFIKLSKNIEEQLESVLMVKRLGVSAMENPTDEEMKYIKTINQLCITDDLKKQRNSLNNKLAHKFCGHSSNSCRIEDAIKKFGNGLNILKKQCDEYDLNNLKKARQELLKKYEIAKNHPLFMGIEMGMEDECRRKFWGASSKQCSCYAQVYFQEMKNLELKVISEKEKCREYKDDLAVFKIESNARKKCGL